MLARTKLLFAGALYWLVLVVGAALLLLAT